MKKLFNCMFVISGFVYASQSQVTPEDLLMFAVWRGNAMQGTLIDASVRQGLDRENAGLCNYLRQLYIPQLGVNPGDSDENSFLTTRPNILLQAVQARVQNEPKRYAYFVGNIIKLRKDCQRAIQAREAAAKKAASHKKDSGCILS